jgi:glutaredoxin
MKKIFCFHLFIVCALFAFSQEKDVQVIVEQTEHDLIFKGINSSLVQQKVILNIDTVNLKGYKGEITKYIPAKDTIVMIRLAFNNNKPWSYSTNYIFDAVPTIAQKVEFKNEVLSNVIDMDKGIVLFYDNGCPRCNYAYTYMQENNIPFRLMDIKSESESEQLMWRLIKLEKPDLTGVQMPVYLINGNISYNIEDLKGFTASLLRFK